MEDRNVFNSVVASLLAEVRFMCVVTMHGEV